MVYKLRLCLSCAVEANYYDRPKQKELYFCSWVFLHILVKHDEIIPVPFGLHGSSHSAGFSGREWNFVCFV